MASVNKVIVVGYLGRDPETKYLADGTAVTNMTVATSYKQKDKPEVTEWHRVSMFARLAEIAGEYLKKGSLVYVEGRLQTRKWQDKDGNDRYSTDIVANSMQMLGGKGSKPAAEPAREEPAAAAKPAADPKPKPKGGAGGGHFDDMEDDIPFASASFEDDVIVRKLVWRNRTR